MTLELPDAPAGTGFTLVGSGDMSSLALGQDGLVYGWGANSAGEVGNGGHDTAKIPTRAHTPEGVRFTQVAVGTFTSYAVGDDGKSYSWGDGTDGVLGNGAMTSRDQPGPIALSEEIKLKTIVAGNTHVFGLDTAGNAHGWGYNLSNELGTGKSSYRELSPVPVAMPAGVTFSELSTLGSHSLAIGSDGATYAWGQNFSGLLGTNSPISANKPTKVTPPRGVAYTHVAAGIDFSIATGDDGRVYGWGTNYQGALGNGKDTDSKTPVRVSLPEGTVITRIVSGGQHTLALTDTGDLWAWGENTSGEIGNGDVSRDGQSVPVQVHAPKGVSFVGMSAGIGTSFARGSDGRTYSWGKNQHWQLGDGTQQNQSVPTPVLPPAVAVQATGVTFGGIPGTDLVDNGDGTVTVSTPAGAAYGPVDIEIAWTADGVAQDPVNLEQAFSYGDEPTVSDPESRVSPIGALASFQSTITGGPEPAIAWTHSVDGGLSWQPVPNADGSEVSSDGQTLTVTVAGSHQNTQYRVTASNEYGSVASAPATLTIPELIVTFDDGSGPEATRVPVLAGATVAAPEPNPTREGFTFAGWLDEAGKPADFTKPVLTERAFSADWTPIPVPRVSVTFDLAGGVGDVPRQTIDAGARATEPAIDPTRSGFHFTGWNDAAGVCFEFQTPISADLTLVAGWERVGTPTTTPPTTTPPTTSPATMPPTTSISPGPGKTPGTSGLVDTGSAAQLPSVLAAGALLMTGAILLLRRRVRTR